MFRLKTYKQEHNILLFLFDIKTTKGKISIER